MENLKSWKTLIKSNPKKVRNYIIPKGSGLIACVVENIINVFSDIQIVHLKNPGWASASRKDGDKAIICVDEEKPIEWKRFAIAHQLGHLLLHDKDEFVDAKFISENKLEKEANDFASELLMPSELISILARKGINQHEMALYLGVSVYAMEVKIAHLGRLKLL